jgi:hypothetical protein
MQQFTSGDALLEYDLTGVIHPNNVKHQLGKVDAKYAHLLCHGIRLLGVHGCLRYHNHFGSLKPHWKEAGPFHFSPAYF